MRISCKRINGLFAILPIITLRFGQSRRTEIGGFRIERHIRKNLDDHFVSEGVAQDYGKAMELLRPQAESGSPNAQYHVGLMYKLGQGVAQDSRKAADWMAKAADWGLVPAQLEYAALLRDGEGVQRDDAQAYKWFTIAAERGEKEHKAKAQAGQAQVRKLLSAEQASAIQADAATWLAQHGR